MLIKIKVSQRIGQEQEQLVAPGQKFRDLVAWLEARPAIFYSMTSRRSRE